MIYLFTDFGYQGPYIGEIQAILNRKLTHQQTTSLMHDAPSFNPKASAYLLAALSRRFEYGDICMAVVDPGVGDPNCKPVLLEVDGINYVGPDNGLFSLIVSRGENVICSEVTWRPEKISATFHGRDLFAPIVVKVALRERFKTSEFPKEELAGIEWPRDLYEIIYIDHYGNAFTGIDGASIDKKKAIVLNGQTIAFAETFSQVKTLHPFWYVNSMGLVEIAINQGNAAEQLGLSIGVEITV